MEAVEVFISLTGLLKLSGKILIDDQIDILELKIYIIKKNCYVPQSIFIHDSSIIENVAFGVEENSIDIPKL